MGLNVATVSSQPDRASLGAKSVERNMSGMKRNQTLWVDWALPVFNAMAKPIPEKASPKKLLSTISAITPGRPVAKSTPAARPTMTTSVAWTMTRMKSADHRPDEDRQPIGRCGEQLVQIAALDIGDHVEAGAASLHGEDDSDGELKRFPIFHAKPAGKFLECPHHDEEEEHRNDEVGDEVGRGSEGGPELTQAEDPDGARGLALRIPRHVRLRRSVSARRWQSRRLLLRLVKRFRTLQPRAGGAQEHFVQARPCDGDGADRNRGGVEGADDVGDERRSVLDK